MFLTDTIRKGLLQLICYDESCGSCVLAEYNCSDIPGHFLYGIVGENRISLLRKYRSMSDIAKKQKNVQAALVYLLGAKMK